MSDHSRCRMVILLYAILGLVVVPVFPHFVSPNEFSRWALVAAVVEHGSIEVSPVLPLLGARFEDLAVVDGRVYSNKAPGLALFSSLGYLVVRPFAGPPSASNLRPVLYAMRLVGSTLSLLLLLMGFWAAASRFGLEDGTTARGLVILAFATPLFAYGLLLFSHALVAAALFGAWAFLYTPGEGHVLGRGIGAGALLGLAAISEFPAAVAGALVLLPLLPKKRFRPFLAAVLGGLPFAVVLAVYQKAAFGSMVRLPYHYEKIEQYREAARSGLLGIQLPSPIRLGAILFDPSKGLLLFAPVLILAFVGLRALSRRMPSDVFFALLAPPLAILLIYSGYANWHGGWTVSARYVSSAIPFLAFILLFRQWGFLERFLLGWSVVAVVSTSLVFPFVPNAFPVPWGSFAFPLLGHGLVVPNIGHLATRSLAFVIPFGLSLAAVAAVLRRHDWLAVLAGAFLALGVGIGTSVLVRDDLRTLQRAYIEEVYFERPGAIDRVARGRTLSPQLRSRRNAELAQPPGSWPF